jgi:hypothetical protein
MVPRLRRCATRSSGAGRWWRSTPSPPSSWGSRWRSWARIYRTQFPVLREYERDTWFDTKGHIAFTASKGLVGVGLDRKSFETWRECLLENRALPSGFETKGLVPPFERRDREEDMGVAYGVFSRPA